MNAVVDLRRHGCRWRIYNSGGRVGHAIEQGRPYEHQLLDEIAERRLTGTAFDVGASVGNHTVFLAAVCGLHVVAFEPDPRVHTMLLDNLALNPGLSVSTYRVAAGNRTGLGRLTSLHRVEDDPAGTVTVSRIDDLLTVGDLSLVKVDVEGHEADVLAGMDGHLRRCHPIVYAEAHNRTAGLRIAEVLLPLGYLHTGTLHMGSPMMRWEWCP